MNKNIIFSNSKDEWYTPKSIIQKFGPFDLDVATTKFNLERLNIPMGYTKEDNGLQQEWNYKKVWCNPPFTLKKEFVDKAIEQHTKYNNDIYILLPMSFETKLFHKLFTYGIDIFIPDGRISFETTKGTHKSPAFGSCILKLNGKSINNIFPFERKVSNAKER